MQTHCISVSSMSIYAGFHFLAGAPAASYAQQHYNSISCNFRRNSMKLYVSGRRWWNLSFSRWCNLRKHWFL